VVAADILALVAIDGDIPVLLADILALVAADAVVPVLAADSIALVAGECGLPGCPICLADWAALEATLADA
jgi:hypothetical protein